MSGGGLAAADAKDDDWGPLYAQIKRVGRWRHEIKIYQDYKGIPMCLNFRAAWSRGRAERKARNLLARETDIVRIDIEVN